MQAGDTTDEEEFNRLANLVDATRNDRTKAELDLGTTQLRRVTFRMERTGIEPVTSGLQSGTDARHVASGDVTRS